MTMAPLFGIAVFFVVWIALRSERARLFRFAHRVFDLRDRGRMEVAVRLVQQALDQDRGARAQNAEREALRKRFESLTPREMAVMRLVVAGLLNKQIASRLGVSEITVKVRRSRMMKKLKAKSPIELAHMAERLAIGGGTELNRSAVTEEQTLPLPPPRRPPH